VFNVRQSRYTFRVSFNHICSSLLIESTPYNSNVDSVGLAFVLSASYSSIYQHCTALDISLKSVKYYLRYAYCTIWDGNRKDLLLLSILLELLVKLFVCKLIRLKHSSYKINRYIYIKKNLVVQIKILSAFVLHGWH